MPDRRDANAGEKSPQTDEGGDSRYYADADNDVVNEDLLDELFAEDELSLLL